MSEPERPPYARIAAELRRRIERGELAAGDRVPSTREITRQWGVAMATATKALAALRDEGLVRGVPGVGTVVAATQPPRTTGDEPAVPPAVPPAGRGGRAGRPAPAADGGAPSPRTPISERIVAAAIEVADAEGLAGLSMRRVAAEVGAATMSLYRHVADKDDLVLQMMNAVFDGWSFPPDPPEGWRARLELAARMLWSVYRRHPWLAPAMSLTRPQAVVTALPYVEWVMTTLAGQGLDPATMLTTHITLFNYIRGTAVHLELESEAQAATGVTNHEWMRAQEPAMRALMEGGQYPAFQQVLAVDYDFDLDALFEFGLQRLLDGLANIMRDQ